MTMLTLPYFGAVAIALAAAGLLTGSLARVRWPELTRSHLWLWSLIAVSATVYTLLGIHKYDAWQYGLWDFGIYESLMHNMVSGNGVMTDFRGKFDHFSPILFLLAPIYAIWKHGIALVAIQAIAMALAAWPLYEYARRYFPKNNIPLYAAICYLLFPYYSRLVLFDFHIECFFPLLFFSAFYLASIRRWRCFFLLLACAPLIKEDFVVPVAGCGLYFACFTRRRWWGIGLIAAAVFWTFFVLKIYYPHLLGMEYWHYGRYELSVANVGNMARRFFSMTTLAALTSVLLPVAFLPLWHWRSFLMILLPTLGVQMVSASFQQSVLADHYGSALLAVAPVLAIFGMRVLRWCARRRLPATSAVRRVAVLAATLLAIVVHIMFCDLVTVRHLDDLNGYQVRFHGGILSLPFSGEHWQLMLAREAHAARVRALLPEFPATLTVVAQNDIGMHFLRHRKVQALPGTIDADLYIFDQANVIDYRDNRKLNEIAANPDYQLVFHADDVLIFQRKSSISTSGQSPKR